MCSVWWLLLFFGVFFLGKIMTHLCGSLRFYVAKSSCGGGCRRYGASYLGVSIPQLLNYCIVVAI